MYGNQEVQRNHLLGDLGEGSNNTPLTPLGEDTKYSKSKLLYDSFKKQQQNTGIPKVHQIRFECIK